MCVAGRKTVLLTHSLIEALINASLEPLIGSIMEYLLLTHRRVQKLIFLDATLHTHLIIAEFVSGYASASPHQNRMNEGAISHYHLTGD